MKFLKMIFFVLLIFCVTDLRAIDIRWFVSWPDDKLERLIKLEKEIKIGLENKTDYKILLSKFNEYVKLSDEGENIMEYLNTTLELSDALANKKDGVKNPNVNTLRNRLGNIYYDWELRFRADLEIRLLNNLYKILSKSSDSGDRMEAATAIGTIGNPDSIKELEKYINDPDKDVKEFVIYALEDLRANKHPPNYKDTLEGFKLLQGTK